MTLRTLLPLALFVTSCGPQYTYVEPPNATVTVTPGLAELTWTPGVNAALTLIARTTSNTEPTAPTGEPQAGSALGDAVVLFTSAEQRFVDNQLPTSCGPFAWHLWGRAADGTWSKVAATVRSQRGQHTLKPTVEVTGLTAYFDGTQLRLAWQPPEASTAFERVTVVRKRGAAPTSASDGTIVYSGPSSSVMEPLANLSPGAATWYSVFNCNSCDACGATAPSVAVLAPGSDGGTSVDVQGLTAQLSADHRDVELSWTTSAPRVRVLRTVNETPKGAFDPAGTVVFDGPGTRATERVSGLLPHLPLDAHRYRYTAWGCVDMACTAVPTSVEFTLTLKQALAAGGYSLYFRHATATTCADNLSLGTASSTSTPLWWRSCNATCGTASALQLTPALADVELGQVALFFTQSGIPVSRLATSEFCRAVQTGQRLNTNASVVEQVPQLTYFVYEEAQRCRDQLSLINAPPEAGTNQVFVGHGDYATPCAVFDSLNPLDAVIYKPTLGAPPKYIARLTPADWASLP